MGKARLCEKIESKGTESYIKENSNHVPFQKKPALSYHDEPRKYGSSRDGGRKHAGCDLIAPVETEILAMKDGTVVTIEDGFFKGASAVGINHGDFVARYCEIKPNLANGIKVGTTVKQGQVIAYVGQLEGISSSMLHLEIYTGTEQGNFTNTNNLPYKRRGDLLNPTDILDKAELSK